MCYISLTYPRNSTNGLLSLNQYISIIQLLLHQSYMPWHEFLVASSENTHYQSVARLWIVIKWNIVIVAFISSIYIVSCLNNKQHNTCDYGLNLTIKTWSRYIERIQIKSNQWYSNRQSAETRIWISSKSEGKIITNVTNSIYICHRRQLIFLLMTDFLFASSFRVIMFCRTYTSHCCSCIGEEIVKTKALRKKIYMPVWSWKLVMASVTFGCCCVHSIQNEYYLIGAVNSENSIALSF